MLAHDHITVLHALQGAQHVTWENGICCCAVRRESLAYSVQRTANRRADGAWTTKIACSRTASGACFLLQIQHGRGLPKPLNTQHEKVKLLEVEFFSEGEKWIIVELNPVQKKKQCVETALLVLAHWLILLIVLLMTCYLWWPTRLRLWRHPFIVHHEIMLRNHEHYCGAVCCDYGLMRWCWYAGM